MKEREILEVVKLVQGVSKMIDRVNAWEAVGTALMWRYYQKEGGDIAAERDREWLTQVFNRANREAEAREIEQIFAAVLRLLRGSLDADDFNFDDHRWLGYLTPLDDDDSQTGH